MNVKKYFKELMVRTIEETIEETAEFATRHLILIASAEPILKNGRKRDFVIIIDLLSAPFKLQIYPDLSCAYCGERLYMADEEPTCTLCGAKTTEEEYKLICANGHHICKNCYYFEVLKPLYDVILLLIKDTFRIKDVAKELAKSEGMDLLEALRHVIIQFLREGFERVGWDVKPLTHRFVPIPYGFLSEVWGEEEIIKGGGLCE